ncbi:MAG: LytTR family DNA-binding domain-containing protein [Bacteroidota bacterium]
MKCLIIDDEPLAREGLAQYASEIDFLQLAGTAAHPLDALPLLEQEKPDLLFLDIEMPKLSGLNFLRSLRTPPLVIITTAYPQYAIESFELEVLDYLLKPITFERFLKSCLRARRRLQEQEEEPASASLSPPELAEIPDHFFIKADGKIERIDVAEFYYAEAMQNYIQLHTARGRFTTLLSLRELSESVLHPHLMRVHKSFLVHLGQVSTVDGRQLVLQDRRIPVSRTKWNEVERRLLGGQLLG